MNKFKKIIEIFELKYKEKTGDKKEPQHNSIYGISAYFSGEDYRQLKYAGIEMNINGTFTVCYQKKYFPIDINKWINDLEEILVTGNELEKTVDDYKLEVIDKLEVDRDRIYQEKYKVKSEILDKLLDRNVSFKKGDK